VNKIVLREGSMGNILQQHTHKTAVYQLTRNSSFFFFNPYLATWGGRPRNKYAAVGAAGF